jgi:hypothetical protein
MEQTYLFCYQLGGGSPGDKRGGDHNVYFAALLQKQFHFGLDEFFRHLFRISSSPRAIFFDINLYELGSKRLHLLACRGPGIESSDYGSHSTSLGHLTGETQNIGWTYRGNCTQTCDTGSNDKNFTRGDLYCWLRPGIEGLENHTLLETISSVLCHKCGIYSPCCRDLAGQEAPEMI